MSSVPYSPEFCAHEECPNLVHRGECALDECIYNRKWIVYWETHGIHPPEGNE